MLRLKKYMQKYKFILKNPYQMMKKMMMKKMYVSYVMIHIKNLLPYLIVVVSFVKDV